MLQLIFFALFCGTLAENELYYEHFSGDVISEEKYAEYEEANKTFWCAGTYKPCDEDEGRRLDTTCNNLDLPTRGTPQTPFIRELPAYYDDGYQPVKQRTGQEMPNARKVRTDLLAEGAIPDQGFTILFSYYMLFMAAQITSFHDTIHFARWRPYCCNAEGRNDPQCNPLMIPADDTVHQFSGLRCFNHTLPITFQNIGCINNDSIPPQRITSSSVFFDLSTVYGLDDKYRANEDGLLQVEEEGDRVWPVSADEETSKEVCFLNSRPQETRCNARSPNSLFPVVFLGKQFWNMHNHIARELKKVNPGWDDEKLFEKARDINVAFSVEVYFYELLPLFMGTRNIVRDKIITRDGGFRDIYDKDLPPQQSMEYSYVMRWGHTIIPGQIRQYDTEGNYLKQIPVVNMTMRTGILAVDNNLEGMTQGAFRQAGDKIDHIVDPFISQTGLAGMQKAFDLTAADLAKAGVQGIRPYVDYREMCTGKKYKSFKDLSEDIIPENLERIKQIYKDVKDVPLLVGVWMEKHYPGSFAPRTLYCLKVKQLKRFIKYDRHWYERANRPNAFSEAQLGEIRKASIARMLCDVGETVTHIQPSAFVRAGPRNKMVSCDNIPNINYEAWADHSS